jgi:uncharacterized protein (PEP-CTERM system associated)
MKTNTAKKASSTRKLRIALLAGANIAMGHAAFAQQTDVTAPIRMQTEYFGYGASVSPRVSYSSNANLAPDGFENGEIYVSSILAGNAIYSARRFTGLITGDLDFSYLTDRGDFVVNQNVAALGSFMVAEDLFYIDVAGSTGRQLVGDNARFSSNLNSGRNQRTNVHTISASPYLIQEFENGVEAEARYRYSQTWFGNERGAFAGLLPNSRSQEVSASANTGKAINRAKFGVGVYGSRNTESGSSIAPLIEFDQASVLGEAEVAVSERFALTGGVGYDEVSSDQLGGLFNLDDLSGVFWKAGFNARPGRKTQIKLQYGRRYGDDFVAGDMSYQISRRFAFSASASQELRSRAQSSQADIRDGAAQAFLFADQLRDGAYLSPEGLISAATEVGSRYRAQSVGIAVRQNAGVALTGVFDRTVVALRGNYSDEDFGYRQILTYSGGLNVQHQLSRKLSAYGDFFYRFADTSIEISECVAEPRFFGFDPSAPFFTDALTVCTDFAAVNGRSNTVGGRIGARHQIYKNVAAFGEVGHTTRFSPISVLEYGENHVSAGLILDF